MDIDQFGQILELDEDDEDSDFSRGMVTEYFEQARKTFAQMDDALCVLLSPLHHVVVLTRFFVRAIDANRKAGDLLQLADLGHFLKGSSACAASASSLKRANRSFSCQVVHVEGEEAIQLLIELVEKTCIQRQMGPHSHYLA